MVYYSMLISCIFCILFALSVQSFQLRTLFRSKRTPVFMGIGDMLKKALANDPSLPPQTNPGLSKDKIMYEVEFLPAKKTIKAPPGTPISVLAQSAGVEIKYKCKKGDCATCTVRCNGVPTKACQSSLPMISNEKKFQIVTNVK